MYVFHGTYLSLFIHCIIWWGIISLAEYFIYSLWVHNLSLALILVFNSESNIAEPKHKKFFILCIHCAIHTLHHLLNYIIFPNVERLWYNICHKIYKALSIQDDVLFELMFEAFVQEQTNKNVFRLF